MLPLAISARIFLSTRPVDFRKTFDGLGGEVRDFLGRDPADGSLFVFYNRRRDRLKMLWWEGDGFWLFYKRLEAGTFEVPLDSASCVAACVLSAEQLQLILSGVQLGSVRWRKRYRMAA
jgi:transposase